MDDNLPFDMEEILRKEVNKAAAVKLVEETSAVESDSLNNSQMYPMVASTEQETIEVGSFLDGSSIEFYGCTLLLSFS